MRIISIFFVVSFLIGTLFAQEQVEIEGAIKLGNSHHNEEGVIRFTGSDYQGFINGGWKSLMTIPTNYWYESGGFLWYKNSTYLYDIPNKYSSFSLHQNKDGIHKTLKLSQYAHDDGFTLGTTYLKGASQISSNSDYLVFSGKSSTIFANNDIESLRITSNGNVGIGTSVPQRQLHIKGNGGVLNLEGTDHTYIQFYPDGFSSGRKAFLGFSNASTSNFTITNQETNGDIEFKTQDGTSYSTKLIIKADGNIGISNSNPNHMLDLGNTLGKKLALYQNSTETAFYGFGISNNTLEFHAESTSNENPQMVLKNTGLVGIGTTNPAVKLNIVGGSDVHVNGGYLQLGASNSVNMGLDDNEIQTKTNGAVSTLHLQNTGGDLNLTQGGGNVGIGILAPTQKLDVLGNIRSSGELIATASTGNQLRLVYGNYGIIHRNDGGNYWILSTASGGQYGTYNSHRPFKLNMASGDMTLNNGSVFFDHSSKRVGIGTTSPGSALQVNGETRLRGTNHQSHFNYSSKEDTYIRGGKTTSNLYLNDTGNKVVVGHSSTPTPGSYKFYVDGGIMAEEVKVALSNTSDWADDAFDRVPTLSKMEESIQTKSHLYGMPSAQELKEKGVNLLEMDALQMEKIEWLYMYVIDQEKRIKELEAEVKKLKQDD